MLSLLNPWVLLAILGMLAGSFGLGHHQAYLEQAAEIERLNQIAQQQKEAADAKLNREQQNAKAKIDNLRSAIDSGSLRLSIPTTQVCNSTSATGDGQARAELDGQTSQNLISITADGDKAIIDLNSCIYRYNSLREIK